MSALEQIRARIAATIPGLEADRDEKKAAMEEADARRVAGLDRLHDFITADNFLEAYAYMPRIRELHLDANLAVEAWLAAEKRLWEARRA